MVSGKELAEFVTSRFLNYAEMSRQDRRAFKRAKRSVKPPWTVRWFGVGAWMIEYWRLQKRAKHHQLSKNYPEA